MKTSALQQRRVRRAIETVKVSGPTFVVVNSDGKLVSPNYAGVQYGIIPDIIFIDYRGRSVGAPHKFQAIAESTKCPDEWAAVIPDIDSGAVLYKDWKRRGDR